MKTSAIALLVVSLGTVAYPKSKEHAVLRAHLIEPGNSAAVAKLVENQSKGHVSSFDYSEADMANHFIVTGRKRLDCGSLRYSAIAPHSLMRMELDDHTNRACDDKAFRWEMRVSGRKLVGNPIPADTDCNQYADGKVCMAQELMADCKAIRYGGEPLSSPIQATASNPCFAQLKIDVEACERGYDPAGFIDSDVMCRIIPPPPVVVPAPCPIPECVAPPPYCQYIPDSSKDENGCPANPCGMMVCEHSESEP
jgi:hypothetical protein